MKSLSGNSLKWSLPCDVNYSVAPSQGYQFLEEARTSKAHKDDKDYTAIDIESLETQRLLDHDSLAQNFDEERNEVTTFVPKFTSRACLQISGTPVDDPIPFQDLDNKKCYDVDTLNSRIHNKYNIYIPHYKNTQEEKKVDENGNALHQNTKKKKKILTDKNVVVRTAESVEGHRSDIIHDVDKLIQYIGGDKDTISSSKNKSIINKSKQFKQHSEDGATQKKKQRTHSTKGKDSRSELKKSNSLGEISTAKLDNFTFIEKEESEVVLRTNKNSQNDRPKERRSWGNMEPSPFQILSGNTSMENIDATGNWVVTKPKKKSKKRRNSISSGRRQGSPLGIAEKRTANRAPSPDLRGHGAKSTRSVPHSERSADSSDADSVHSLPIDSLNVPISYADIAKNSERFKEKKTSPEKPILIEKTPPKDLVRFEPPETKPSLPLPTTKKLPEKTSLLTTATTTSPPDTTKHDEYENNGESSPLTATIIDTSGEFSSSIILQESTTTKTSPLPPPDVHNIKSFPAMPVPSLKVEKTTIGGAVKVLNRPRNLSPSKVKTNNVSNSNNNALRSNQRNMKGHNDIQNDLTIIHSNEKESIQYNAQMLPPDIPDVRTIEKMHFMNRQYHHQQQHYNSTKIVPQNNSPVVTHHSQVPQQPKDNTNNIVVLSNNNTNNNNVNCDSSERIMTNNEDDVDDDEDVDDIEGESPPPVVILSGVGNKEVSGLVFGFDVNEQLLNEDICENFISRYVAPECFENLGHNHDKIVNFIGSAWEAIINQSNGKVQYYREES